LPHLFTRYALPFLIFRGLFIPGSPTIEH